MLSTDTNRAGPTRDRLGVVTTRLLLILLVMLAGAAVRARADVLLQGDQHVGDTWSHNGQVFTPDEPLSLS
ncbi:MAG: hypothetical protein PVG21_05330, partial [Gammaproteobacteria bacterium]